MAKTLKTAGSTSGAGGDKSATRTASNTKTATATKTNTEAYTQGNITVTGGAGAGDTQVFIGGQPEKPVKDDPAHDMFLKSVGLK